MIQSAEGRNVLLVDSDSSVVNVARDYLTRAGFQVLVASNTWEALKRAKDSPIDIVVASLSSTDHESMSLRDKLFMNPSTREIPFLYLVASGDSDVMVNALRSGVDDCLAKPFDPVMLVARLQAVLLRRSVYERMVRLDPLTRLLNRPTLLDEVHLELERVKRYQHTASLLLLDLEGLSEVNAANGPAMGDLLLTCLSSVILNSLRYVDIPGRYCGDSFLLCLPDTQPDGARIVAERSQELLGKASNTIADAALTMSGGIVQAPEHGDSLETLLPKVQQALDWAKQLGKGTVLVWSETPPPFPARLPD